MKALYVALHNPTILDLASGVDYFHYQALLQDDFEVKWIAPNPKRFLWVEEMLSRVFQRTGKRFVSITYRLFGRPLKQSMSLSKNGDRMYS
jgi:hypothetical protein